MNYTTVTDLQKNGKLQFFRGRYNILDCGVRTGKTYWAINNLLQYTRDGQLSRILFLTDTTSLKISIIEQYGEKCCEADDFWIHTPEEWSIENKNKIGIMCYQALGMRIMRDDIGFLDDIDVICWDECDSIFDFAVTAFARARKYDFSRKTSTNAEILNLIQEHSSKKEYMPLVLLGAWEKIINTQRILCIGLSATPERAQAYYQSLVNTAYQGKLDVGFRAANDIYFKNILEHIKNLTPIPGNGYWCFSPSIEYNKAIVAAANNQGFHAICIHSSRSDKPMDEEQQRVAECIKTLHIVPLEYDFVVVTKAYERGIDIIDARFKNLIVDSYYRTDRIQAARQVFPYQRHVKVLSLEVPEEYKNKWLTVEECKILAEYLAVPDIDIKGSEYTHHTSRIMTWNKLQEVLTTCGYNIQKARKRLNGSANAVTAYYISGEWHDIEINKTEAFLELVQAKMALDDLEEN